MQLSDILKDTDAIHDAISEMKFQAYLKKISELPDWKKGEIEKEVNKRDFTWGDLARIFGCGDESSV